MISAETTRVARDRYRLAALLFEARLALTHRLLTKYAEDQPRVPAGSPDGGQWASGLTISSPLQLLDALNLWELAGNFLNPAIFRVSVADIPVLSDMILEWLGPGTVQQNSPNGAIQFLSSDRTRKIRFDITPATSHRLKPHINIDPGGLHLWLKP